MKQWQRELAADNAARNQHLHRRQELARALVREVLLTLQLESGQHVPDALAEKVANNEKLLATLQRRMRGWVNAQLCVVPPDVFSQTVENEVAFENALAEHEER